MSSSEAPASTGLSRTSSSQQLPPISTVTTSASISTSTSQLSSPTLSSDTTYTTTDVASTDLSLQQSQSPQMDPWPSLNPLTAYYTPGHAQASADSPLRMDVDPMSPDGGRASSVSLDDPDVRLAAEALGDLRADFVSSPTPAASRTPPGRPEPLLSLLTTSHPLLAKTIEGTTSAYNTSKNFSPRIKSGVEYVEGYLTPLGNTIGTVSRATGVEGGVRWFLGHGRQHHRERSSNSGSSDRRSSHKRRRLGRGPSPAGTGDNAEMGAGLRKGTLGYASDTTVRLAPIKQEGNGNDLMSVADERRLSMSTVETLPAYDEQQKSPDYSEQEESPRFSDRGREASRQRGDESQEEHGGSPSAPWQSRLIMSTSGLSVAMSEESLRSLKYCLNWLRWANDHIGTVIGTLKTTVEQYDTAEASRLERESSGQSASEAKEAAGEHAKEGSSTGRGSAATTPTSSSRAEDDRERSELAAQIVVLRGDVLHTLRGVVETVSVYAGGALPENARVLVRKHLTSLPQRFRLANQSEEAGAGASGTGTGTGLNTNSSHKEIRDNAQRVLVLAREGLDMMSQVSGVLDGTIVSAEEWCERLGRRKRGSEEESQGASQNQDQRAEDASTPRMPATGESEPSAGHVADKMDCR